MREKHRKRSKNIIIDERTGLIVGIRTITQYGNSLYVSIPMEWIERQNLAKGDALALIGGNTLEFMSIKKNDAELKM